VKHLSTKDVGGIGAIAKKGGIAKDNLFVGNIPKSSIE